MSIFDEYLARHHGAVAAAAKDFGRGLMAGDPSQFKAGYSADSALLVVRDGLDLDGPEADVVAAHLAGFADGLEQPDELEHGRTYEDPALNEAYDEGVNAGQDLARQRA